MPVMKLRYTIPVATMVAAAGLTAQEWPQWRGPSGDATVAASQAPAAWPASFSRRWRADVGEGYSSPVVSAGRIFVHSRKDPQEIVTALDAASGAVIWQKAYASAFNKNGYAVKMGKGPNATPLVQGGRVFTLGASGHLNAWDTASGKLIWAQDYSARVDTSKLFCGTSASPVIVNGMLIIQVGSDVKGGLITALDPATGATKWEWSGDGPGYATPTIATAGAARMIVAVTNRSLVGVDVSTGKQLWTTPFVDEWHENIVTPIWTGTSLIVSGVRQGTHAYELTAAAGGAVQVREIWKNADVAMYMSSPVYGDGLIYGLSYKKKGQFVAVDARTGVTKWATEGREAEHASALLAPKHVLFLTNAGSLVVAKRSAAAFEVEKKYELDGSSETWAAPIVLGSDLIIRDATGVTRLRGTGLISTDSGVSGTGLRGLSPDRRNLWKLDPSPYPGCLV